MPRHLTITPAPYKSSYLTIPPTPFSPLLPITPPASPPKTLQNPHTDRAAKLKSTAALLPPPSEPLHWLWQCHKCNRVYQLGVTRRCLDDGHFFCAGTTVAKKGGKKNGYKKFVRHQACASEFDYAGWKDWGVWRRGIVEQMEAAEAVVRAEEEFERQVHRQVAVILPTPQEGKWFRGSWVKKPVRAKVWDRPKPLRKNCWERCDYPSECRWGKQFGVATPKAVVANVTATVPFTPPTTAQQQATPANELKIKTSFEEILGLNAIIEENVAIAEAGNVDYLEPLSPTHSSSHKSLTEGETKTVSMDDLLESAKRRKRRSSGQLRSPLGANPPSPEEEKNNASSQGSAGT